MSEIRPWDSILSFSDVATLYGEGIRRYGGDPSEPKPGCVDGSVGAAWSAESYADPDPGRLPGLVFAGYLLFIWPRITVLPTETSALPGRRRCMCFRTTVSTVDASIDESSNSCCPSSLARFVTAWGRHLAGRATGRRRRRPAFVSPFAARS